MRLSKTRVLHLIELLSPVALLGIWWQLSASSTSVYFPPLRDIVSAFADAFVFERVGSDVVPSIRNFIAGYAIAIVLGALLGAALGLSRRARRDSAIFVEFFRVMPMAALLPAALGLVGPGPGMEIGLIAFACIWPILVSAADGARGVEPLMIESARAYGVSRRDVILRVIVPATMPQLFAGIRIALPIGIAVMLVANMFVTTAGLGFVVVQAQQTFNLKLGWATIVLLGILGTVSSFALALIENRALRWHRGWRATTKES